MRRYRDDLGLGHLGRNAHWSRTNGPSLSTRCSGSRGDEVKRRHFNSAAHDQSHYYGSDQAKPVARAAFFATRLRPAPVFRTALFADFTAFAVLDFLRFAIFVPPVSRFVQLGSYLHLRGREPAWRAPLGNTKSAPAGLGRPRQTCWRLDDFVCCFNAVIHGYPDYWVAFFNDHSSRFGSFSRSV